MMFKQMFTVILLASYGMAVSSAQTDVSDEAQAGNDAVPQHEPNEESLDSTGDVLEAVEAEFRELVCSQAADPSYVKQKWAIDVVIRRKYVDERFDDLIRETMAAAAKPYRWDVAQLSRAEQLLSVSTLDGKERTELVFRCYMMCGDERSDQILARALRQRLDVEPDETSRLVKQRMLEDGVTPELLSIVMIVGESSESMLPILMKAARSDDRALSEEAMRLIPQLIDQLKEFNERKRRAMAMKSALENTDLDQIDPKLVNYAKRLVSRYDTNGDARLTPAEYDKMLMSPAAADIDGDGAITVEEYAIWMRSRSKR